MVPVDGARVAVLPADAAAGGRERNGWRGVRQQVLRVLQQRAQLRVQHVEPAQRRRGPDSQFQAKVSPGKVS